MQVLGDGKLPFHHVLAYGHAVRFARYGDRLDRSLYVRGVGRRCNGVHADPRDHGESVDRALRYRDGGGLLARYQPVHRRRNEGRPARRELLDGRCDVERCAQWRAGRPLQHHRGDQPSLYDRSGDGHGDQHCADHRGHVPVGGYRDAPRERHHLRVYRQCGSLFGGAGWEGDGDRERDGAQGDLQQPRSAVVAGGLFGRTVSDSRPGEGA